ncbi:MAG: sugar phosphate nucleotidyltransferase [bacterium]
MYRNCFAVILAGGKGERFWPLSTSRHPKQLLSLVGDKSLLEQAVERLRGLIPPERVIVITNADLVEASRKAAPSLPPQNIIGEPVGRDTAAAVALGAALVKAKQHDGVFCVLTADHIIGDLPLFRGTLSAAFDIAAKEDVLITIGIQPTEPSTGYGYIEAGDIHRDHNGITFLRAKRFVEKPNVERANAYVASGNFLWNSGMFIWSVQSLAAGLRRHRPSLAHLLDQMAHVAWKPGFEATMAKVYQSLEKISIDYALMEKSDNILVARGVFVWDDVGNWAALKNHFPEDLNGNTVIGSCEQQDAKDNIVYSKNHLTALVGVRDLVVVQADGVTLVCTRDKAQDIKKLVAKLRQAGQFNQVL